MAGPRRRTASTIQTLGQPPAVFVRGAGYYAQGPVNRRCSPARTTDKFRALRITHVGNPVRRADPRRGQRHAHPEQVFLTAVDDALDQRRANRIDKLIRQAGFRIPPPRLAELDYREGRGINPTRMKRYGSHDWRPNPRTCWSPHPPEAGRPYLVCAGIGIPPATVSTTSSTLPDGRPGLQP